MAAGTSKKSGLSSSATVSDDISPESVEIIDSFFNRMGAIQTLRAEHNVDDSFSNLIGGLIKVKFIQRGKISCLLTVKDPILNRYGGMHGGAIGAVAERVAIACATTVVGKDKDIFLAELSILYLSAAPRNAELVVDGSVVRSGRNLTVVTVDFRLKESERLVFTTRATFFNMPVSRL